MMWARVKGETENALPELSPRAHMFRPAFIIPLPGTTARTASYVLLYKVVGPLYPVLRRIAPRYVTTSLHMGQAMIRTARGGVSRHWGRAWHAPVITTTVRHAATDLAELHGAPERGWSSSPNGT